MDEPGWAWPAWKFGMKRQDLTTKLHDQYNTFPSSIQDPEAFHADVFEISHEASTTDEFHRLMAARKQQRLQELNESLESAAFEIIAHPKLIGTDQWQHALQLFRTKSLDSLVRYFSSYLPENYLERHAHGYQTPSSVASSFADCSSVKTASTNPSTVDGHIDDGDVPVTTFLADEDKAAGFTHEPEHLHDSLSVSHDTKIPPSPRSMSMKSDNGSSPADETVPRDFALHPPTPARTMSFSGSESGGIPRPLSKSLTDDDDETSQSEGESPAASEPDMSESRSSLESMGFSVSDSERRHARQESFCEEEEEFPTAQLPTDYFDEEDEFETVQFPTDPFEMMESDTPTPRQETMSASYIDSKSIRSCRMQSPHRASSPKSPRLRRREGSPQHCTRRSPEELLSRVQKSSPDLLRTRLKGRRRLD